MAVFIAFFMERAMHEPSFMRHFTYWVLMLSTVFAVVWVVAIGADAKGDPSQPRGQSFPEARDPPPISSWAMSNESAVLTVFLFPVVACLLMVMLLIVALPLFSSEMIEKQTEGMDLGVANAANFVIHTVPFMLFGGMGIIRRHEIRQAATFMTTLVRQRFGDKGVFKVQSAVCATNSIVGPTSLACLYVSFFNPNTEYTADAPVKFLMLGSVITLVFVAYCQYVFMWALPA